MSGEEDNGDRRPRRRCASRAAAQRSMPSAVHYVGYVEDDETPEAIMRKFEEMERIKHAIKEQQEQKAADQAAACNDDERMDGEEAPPAAPGAEPMEELEGAIADGLAEDLTEEQLLEVFKQTSMFNVRTALQNNEALQADYMMDSGSYGDEDPWSDDDDSAEYLAGFWSDEDDGDYAAHWRSLRRKKGERGPRRAGGGATMRTKHVAHYNAASQAFIRRKVKAVDADAIYQLRIPPAPVPLSWARTVQPYMPKEVWADKRRCISSATAATEQQQGDAAAADVTAAQATAQEKQQQAAECNYVELPNVADADPKSLRPGGYLGVLINNGWEAEEEEEEGTRCSGNGQRRGGGGDEAVVRRLQQLQINRLCPTGFVFIWVDKRHIMPVMDLMYKLRYIYVENLNWVYMDANNEFLGLPSDYFAATHLTMFIFRKDGEGKDIELRHQRNPDVLFDCVVASEGRPHGIPEEAYIAIETLLPTAKGKLLELWAPRHVKRAGWTHLVDVSKCTAAS